jgi:hypothetical protein
MKYRNIAVGVILGFLVFLSACASVERFQEMNEIQWTPIATGQDGGAEICVDEKSIQHISDGVVRLRVRYRYSSPKPFDSGYIDELVVNNEYDCDNEKTHKILWSEAHYIDGGIRRDSLERQGYILPGDAVFRYVCK